MTLHDLLAKRRSSSGSLEKPSSSPLPVAAGAESEAVHDPEATPVAASDGPTETSQEGFLSEPLTELTEASRLSTGSRSENEADGEAPTRSGNESPSDPSIPFGVAQVVTPSGIEIYFQAGPKRLYRLRDINIADSQRTPLTDWIVVPSMSDVKDILDKPALPWWGMKIGIQSTLDVLGGESDFAQTARYVGWPEFDQVLEEIKSQKLTVNHVRDKAGDRGTNVHKALELWADTGTIPVPDVFGPEERGYVQGLKDFLYDSEATPLASEVMVGSLEWGFAGRFDLIAEIPEGRHVFVHRTKKGRGDRCEEIPAGKWLLDLKTSKDVYASHMLQLAGYELAYQECYGEDTDFQGVIQVSEDGRYKLVQSRATPYHFKSLKQLYDSLKEIG